MSFQMQLEVRGAKKIQFTDQSTGEMVKMFEVYTENNPDPAMGQFGMQSSKIKCAAEVIDQFCAQNKLPATVTAEVETRVGAKQSTQMFIKSMKLVK